jgi:hypothetical protein
MFWFQGQIAEGLTYLWLVQKGLPYFGGLLLLVTKTIELSNSLSEQKASFCKAYNAIPSVLIVVG